MKLTLHQRDDGTWAVVAKKTRPWENPTLAVYGVEQEDLEKVIGEVVDAVVGGGKPEIPSEPF